MRKSLALRREKRRVALSPALLLSNRTVLLLDEPTNTSTRKSVEWLARSFSSEVPGYGRSRSLTTVISWNNAEAGSSSSTAATHPWRATICLRGWGRRKSASRSEREAGAGAHQIDGRRSWNGCADPKGRQAKSEGAARALEELSSRDTRSAMKRRRFLSRLAERLASGDRVQGREARLTGERLLIRRSVYSSVAPGAIRRHHRRQRRR